MENNYTSFKENLAKDAQQLLGSSYTVELQEIKKLNQDYDALLVRPAGDAIAVSVDIRPFAEKLGNGDSYEKLVSELADFAKEALLNPPQFDIESCKDYNIMKNKLVIEVVSKERNAKLLATVPHKDFEDMAIVYRFLLGKGPNETRSILVNNGLMDMYGITTEQLHEDALKNAPMIRPLKIEGMSQVLAKTMGVEEVEQLGLYIPPEQEKLFVASVEGETHGAGCIAYQNFMEKASEKVGGSFFILPSSIHECLLIPDDGQFTVDTLESMVREVNATTVSPEDQLTDSVYHYDSENKIFELAEKYIARISDASEEKVG